jgi:undecaprenyl-diphosphatase
MDSMNWLHVVLLSIIEGLTEFLPISSTGHMIIASTLFGIQEDQFVQNFEILIQFSAILAVAVLYWKQLLNKKHLIMKISLATVPLLIIGFLFKSKVEALLSETKVVAASLIVGGLVFLIFEKYIVDESRDRKYENLTLVECLKLGLFQCFALIPGTSRSGATIIGGLILKLSRKEAAEFSFLLAIPALSAITLYKTYKILPTIQSEQITYLTVGSIISFCIAYAAMKYFIHLVTKYGFRFFGWYRIILGCLVLIMIEIVNFRKSE